MDLTIQIKIINNVKHRQAIYLRNLFGERPFTSLTMLRHEVKVSICYIIK